jgi:hypothetical protein
MSASVPPNGVGAAVTIFGPRASITFRNVKVQPISCSGKMVFPLDTPYVLARFEGPPVTKHAPVLLDSDVSVRSLSGLAEEEMDVTLRSNTESALCFMGKGYE